MEITQIVRRNKKTVSLAVAVAVVVVGLGAYWFGPWHLFVNRTADESLPAAPAEIPAADDATAGAVGEPDDGGAARGGGATVLAEGSFRSLAHESTGIAKLVEIDGATFLRFEDLDVLSGPDLRVYLSSAPGDAAESAFGEDQLVADLGGLRANKGNLTYEIPSGVDLEQVRSVSVWCRRFSVGFGVAPLDPPA
jgi:hypothetical protein